jgi:hypothetical protein
VSSCGRAYSGASPLDRLDHFFRCAPQFRAHDVGDLGYTVIESWDDEVVTPYTNAFLPAAPNVTSITVNKQSVLDSSDHLEIAADPVAVADMLDALDPAHPVRVPCLVVLPVTGPIGPVPSS